MRDWAKKELLGYHDGDEIPSYRIVAPFLMGDGQVHGGLFKGMAIPWTSLPAFARDDIKDDELNLTSGVATLDEIARSAGRNDDMVKISVFMGADLGRLMSNENIYYERIYWGVAASLIRGVLDEIRTTAVSVLAEVRSGTPTTGPPSAVMGQLVDQAVNVNVYGGRRHTINVTTNQGGAGDSGPPAVPDSPTVSMGRSLRRLLSWIGLGAVVLAAAVGLVGKLWLW